MRARFVNEIGEGSSPAMPFEYKGMLGDILHQYHFKIDDTKYLANFYNPQVDKKKVKDDYVIDFNTFDDEFETVTNLGDFFKIIPTVIAITEDFYKNHKVRRFILNPVKSYRGDKRRYNVFLNVVEKNIPDGWDIKPSKFWNKIVIIPSSEKNL